MNWLQSIRMRKFLPYCNRRGMHCHALVLLDPDASLFPPFCFFFPPSTAFRDVIKSCIGLRRSKAETLLSAALSRFDSCTGDSGILLGYHSIGRLPECLPLRCCLGFFSNTPLWPNRWFYAGHWLTIGWPPVASHYIPNDGKDWYIYFFLPAG